MVDMDKGSVEGLRSASDGLSLFQFVRGLEQVSRPFSSLAMNKNSAIGRLISGGRRFFSVVDKIGRHIYAAEMLDKAGWLAHHTMPLEYIEECVWSVSSLDESSLDKLLLHHYQERWSEVRRNIETRLMQYDVDDEAKKILMEALDAHENGLYRSVCAGLMSGVERIARIELHGNSMERIASQHKLRKLIKALPISAMNPKGFFAHKLCKRLAEHMYAHVDDESDRLRFAQDSIPNRHAVVHGHIVYSTMQSSLNAIFMADFILQAIDIMKTRRLERTA